MKIMKYQEIRKGIKWYEDGSLLIDHKAIRNNENGERPIKFKKAKDCIEE